MSKKLAEEIKCLVKKCNWININTNQSSRKIIKDLNAWFKSGIMSFPIVFPNYILFSEDFIARFRDDLNWTQICYYQKLSENFIRKMKKYVDWENIYKNQQLSLSPEFIQEFYNEFKTYVEAECEKLIDG